MYLLGGFEGMLIRGECWEMTQFEAYFDTIFFPQKILYIFPYCTKIMLL